MKNRFALLALAAAASLTALSASAQTYTVKLGAGYIDPNATSSSLRGGVYSSAVSASVELTGGVALKVKPESTVIASIERHLDDNWSVELIGGYPPKHDVELVVGNIETSPGQLTGSPAAGLVQDGVKQKIAGLKGQKVAAVRQWAPTVMVNYRFLEASSAFRPYVGIGLNWTRFKSSTTTIGDKLYEDGKPTIKLTDSIGPAIQVGASYKLDKNWSVNASLLTTQVDNKLTVTTRSGQKQRANFRFVPTVVAATVGYSF